MNIHEHQAKDLLRRYGVAVPDGRACFSVDEAVAAAERLGFPCVVKGQIHTGGRGKAGGGEAGAGGGAPRAPGGAPARENASFPPNRAPGRGGGPAPWGQGEALRGGEVTCAW